MKSELTELLAMLAPAGSAAIVLAILAYRSPQLIRAFPEKAESGFPDRGESDSSFLLEEASMDGEAVFGGLESTRGGVD